MNEFEHGSLELNTAGVTGSAVTRSLDDQGCYFFSSSHKQGYWLKGHSPPKKKPIWFRFAAGWKAGVKYLAWSRSAS